MLTLIDEQGVQHFVCNLKRACFSGAVSALGSKAGSGQVELVNPTRSEEHTSELQSRTNLVCRLLLEKKKKKREKITTKKKKKKEKKKRTAEKSKDR